MKKFLFLTFTFICICFQANAALIKWDSANQVDSDWNNTANWIGGIVPVSTDDVEISGSSAIVDISTTVTVLTIEIKSGADLTIASTGILNLGCTTCSSTNGALDLDSTSGTVTNNGTISILNTAENGIHVKGTFENGGTVNVNGAENGIFSTASGTVNNNVDGIINVSNYTEDGIAVDDGTTGGVLLPSTFNNSGTITVDMPTGGVQSDHGIYVNDLSIFNNLANSTINVNNGGGDDGINVYDGGIFNNDGTYNYTFSAGTTTSNAISVDDGDFVSTFNNNADGEVIIMGSGNDAITVGSDNDTGDNTINNAGSIDIKDSGDHGIELKGKFVNTGSYKDTNSDGDALRIESTGKFDNSGTIDFHITSSTSDAIENKGTFNALMGSVINIGCPGINEVEVNNGNLDLGMTTINFDIMSPGTGGTDFDRFEIKATVMDISGATANIVFNASYTPTVGDCFKIVDGNSDGTGTVSGTFAAITSSDPSVSFDIDYTDPTEVEICIADPCGAAAVGLSGSGTKTAAASCEDGDWSYYEDPSSPGAYMFAIEWDVAGNGSNAIAKASAIVTITLDAAIGSATAGTNGTWTMKRHWDVSSSALVDPVNVKFFYDQTEVDDVVGAQSTFGGTSEGFAWFKTVGTSFDPAMIDEYGVNQNAIVLADVSGGAMENGVLYAQFDGIESFSGGTGASGSGNGSSVLPIELASFTGKSMSRSNILEWTTASEINTEFHIIERSLNGRDNWIQVGKVDAKGNSNTSVSYSIEDTKPTAKSYYRLRSVDLDGYEGLSHVVYLERKIDRFEIIGTYPVPTMNSLSIDFETVIEQEVNIKMTDILGNEISQSVFAASAGINTKTLDMSQLSSGVYFIILHNGMQSITKRVIKN